MNKKERLKITNALRKDTLMETLDIEYIDAGADFLTARMPVNQRVSQPDGVLHGGATFALAESVGSAAAFVFNEQASHVVRGIEMSGNHIKSAKAGFVYAKAQHLHLGKTTQLWDIKVTDDEGKLISSCKLTTITLPKK